MTTKGVPPLEDQVATEQDAVLGDPGDDVVGGVGGGGEVDELDLEVVDVTHPVGCRR